MTPEAIKHILMFYLWADKMMPKVKYNVKRRWYLQGATYYRKDGVSLCYLKPRQPEGKEPETQRPLGIN